MLSSCFIRILKTNSCRILPMTYRRHTQLIFVGKPSRSISIRHNGSITIRNNGSISSGNNLVTSSTSKTLRSIHTTFALHKTVTAVVPTFGESISEGDVKFTCKIGDTFHADDVVMEIETDKTSVTVPAPITGKITAILVVDGESVKQGQELFKMVASAVAAKPAAAAKASAAAKPQAAAAKVKAPPKLVPGNELVGERKELRVAMNPIRQEIVTQMKEIKRTYALLTTMNEINMSTAIAFREERKEKFLDKYGVKLTMLSLFMKAVAIALQGQPVLNAVIEGKEVVYRDYCDIKVSLAAQRGIFQPVIRNVESKNLVDIETEIMLTMRKEKSNKLLPEHLMGGTFTISNTGVLGSLLETPMVCPSQGAAFAMHAIKERPVAIKGEIHVHPMMYVALTYDHRLIDGREAVLFLRKVKSCIEDAGVLRATMPK